jgi:hypothetical protein
MSPRFRNKLLTGCVALLASTILVAASASLELIALHGVIGWLIRTLPLVVPIPAVLFGYEALCDWYYQRFIDTANEKFALEQTRIHQTHAENTPVRRRAMNGFDVAVQRAMNGSRRPVTTASGVSQFRAADFASRGGNFAAPANRWVGQ